MFIYTRCAVSHSLEQPSLPFFSWSWSAISVWPNKPQFTLFCREIRFVLIYALLGVKFGLQKSCLCNKNYKYQVWVSVVCKICVDETSLFYTEQKLHQSFGNFVFCSTYVWGQFCVISERNEKGMKEFIFYPHISLNMWHCQVPKQGVNLQLGCV